MGMVIALLASMTVLPVQAQEGHFCFAVESVKNAAVEHGAEWIKLTNEQWQFLRGVSAVVPSTPTGLPYGDQAFLVQAKGDPGGLVWFVDGSRACDPMGVPKVLLDLILQVGRGEIMREGAKL